MLIPKEDAAVAIPVIYLPRLTVLKQLAVWLLLSKIKQSFALHAKFIKIFLLTLLIQFAIAGMALLCLIIFVNKFVVMGMFTQLNVMMEIWLMEMAALRIAQSKMVLLVKNNIIF